MAKDPGLHQFIIRSYKATGLSLIALFGSSILGIYQPIFIDPLLQSLIGVAISFGLISYPIHKIKP